LGKLKHSLVEMQVFKGDHLKSDFREINPDRKVPALVDGKFSLFESHSILRYLCESRGMADHFYPR
jgi:glutathione S-transferase